MDISTVDNSIYERTSSLNTDGSRNRIYPADVAGRFTRARTWVFWLLIGVYAALPWVKVGGYPAMFLDVEHRRFFLFGNSFNAQDFWLVFFLLTGIGFTLFYVTTLLGRIWCGWACPQTVFLEAVYRPIERFIEGPRATYLRRRQGGWTFDRVWRRAAIYTAYVVVSIVIAHILLSYFVSLPAMFAMVRSSPAAHPEAFAWVTAITALLFFNFAWFREQLCLVICPYGRLQSVMTDSDTLVIGYDQRRGEPRGKAKQEGVGDCVDCKRCVVVCPTGIDIRNGWQIDCIGCSACIDACDDIMTSLKRPKGLVRYDSMNGLAGKPRRILRPRIVLYSVLYIIGGIVAAAAVGRHSDFEANLLRLPGAPYQVDGETVRNALQIHLFNKQSTTVTFTVSGRKAANLQYTIGMPKVTLNALDHVYIPVFASVPKAAYKPGLQVLLDVEGGGDAKHLRATLLGPAASEAAPAQN